MVGKSGARLVGPALLMQLYMIQQIFELALTARK
jgi:hypothetical protein